MSTSLNRRALVAGAAALPAIAALPTAAAALAPEPTRSSLRSNNGGRRGPPSEWR
jgi:hypothetical protein